MTPLISIIICTCNRAGDLRQTLASLAEVCVPEAMPTELLVVDNASTDETAEVVASCQLPNMLVRYIHEPRRGKGYAYNTGMAEAHGDVFLFTDDDVRPPKNWIEGMCGPIVRGEADAVAGGVRLAPHLERPWMTDLHKIWMASTEHLNKENPGCMVGANMAFSKRVLDKVPGFDPELGPGAIGFADDLLFSFQLAEAGYKIKSALHISIVHHFQASRLSYASFVKRAVGEGKAFAYLTYHYEHRRMRIAILRYAISLFQLACFQLLRRTPSKDCEGILESEARCIASVSFYESFLFERKRPRNYQKHGTMKITSASSQR